MSPPNRHRLDQENQFWPKQCPSVIAWKIHEALKVSQLQNRRVHIGFSIRGADVTVRAMFEVRYRANERRSRRPARSIIEESRPDWGAWISDRKSKSSQTRLKFSILTFRGLSLFFFSVNVNVRFIFARLNRVGTFLVVCTGRQPGTARPFSSAGSFSIKLHLFLSLRNASRASRTRRSFHPTVRPPCALLRLVHRVRIHDRKFSEALSRQETANAFSMLFKN